MRPHEHLRALDRPRIERGHLSKVRSGGCEIRSRGIIKLGTHSNRRQQPDGGHQRDTGCDNERLVLGSEVRTRIKGSVYSTYDDGLRLSLRVRIADGEACAISQGHEDGRRVWALVASVRHRSKSSQQHSCCPTLNQKENLSAER